MIANPVCTILLASDLGSIIQPFCASFFLVGKMGIKNNTCRYRINEIMYKKHLANCLYVNTQK